MKDNELRDLYYMMKSKQCLISANDMCSPNHKMIEQGNQKHILEDDIKSRLAKTSSLESDNEQDEVSSFIFLNYT